MSHYPYNAGNMTMTIPIAKFAELHDKIKIREAENARLKAEVERLTKAGDAVCESPYLWETDPAVIEWRAAKEGKQS
jgi:hypothetical protein